MGLFTGKTMGGGQSLPDVPIDKIRALKQQGYDNNQIIQTLQRDGYNSSQIFDALSQVENPVPNGTEMGFEDNSQALPGAASPAEVQQAAYPAQQQIHNQQSYNTEELVEAIIDEKWNDLIADINKIIEWKNSTESRISAMQQEMQDIRSSFDKLHEALLGKIGEYDQHILEVGTEVKAMEKVFSKVLPVFTKNVQDLNEITKRLGSSKGR